MRIAITTLGCKINQYESDLLKHDFASRGDSIVPFDAEADVYVINTCSVTAKSDVQSRQLIRAAVKRAPGAKVVVTGCYAETQPDELRNIPGVGLVIGNREKSTIPLRLAVNDETVRKDEAGTVMFKAVRTRTRAFLKIQDGCNNHCTYCIVPRARGKSRSIPILRVLDEVSRLGSDGCPEIVLTGIHLGSYGVDLKEPMTITDAVRWVIERSASSRIRLSSIEPLEITDQLIGMLGKGLCRHLHIPLQSGDDAVLERMHRNYTKNYYMDLVQRIAESVPGVALGADVMVGFPGETDNEFENTMKFIEQSPLTHLHVFTYSRRPGTIAAGMKNQVPEDIKKRRSEALRSVGRKNNQAFVRKMTGQKLDVVVEDKKHPESGLLMGVSDNYIRVQINGAKTAHIGGIIPVQIDQVMEGENIATKI